MDGFACMFVGLVITILVSIFIIGAQNEKKRKTEAARLAYQKNLQLLRENPGSADQRQRTLEAGRYYSSLTREDRRITTYDESAINNDILAACGGTAVSFNAPPPVVPDAGTEAREDDIARLERLAKLHEHGSLTSEEFQTAKAKLLGLDQRQHDSSARTDILKQAENIRRAHQKIKGSDPKSQEQRQSLQALYDELNKRLRNL